MGIWVKGGRVGVRVRAGWAGTYTSGVWVGIHVKLRAVQPDAFDLQGARLRVRVRGLACM